MPNKPNEILVREMSLALVTYLESKVIENSYFSAEYFPFIRAIILSFFKPYEKRGKNPLIEQDNHGFFKQLHSDYCVNENSVERVGPQTKLKEGESLYVSRVNVPAHYRGGGIGELFEPYIRLTDSQAIKVTGNFPDELLYLNEYFYFPSKYFIPSRPKKIGWAGHYKYRTIKKVCLNIIAQFKIEKFPELEECFFLQGFEKSFHNRLATQLAAYNYYVAVFRRFFQNSTPSKVYLSHLFDPMNVAASLVASEFGVERYGFQRGLSLGADAEIMGLHSFGYSNLLPEKIMCLNEREARIVSKSNSDSMEHRVYGDLIFKPVERAVLRSENEKRKTRVLLILQSDNILNKAMLSILDEFPNDLFITVRQHPVYQFSPVVLSMFLEKMLKADFQFDSMRLPLFESILKHDIVVTNYSTGLALSEYAEIPCLSLYLPAEYDGSSICERLTAEALAQIISTVEYKDDMEPSL